MTTNQSLVATGARIRARRIELGMSQEELAFRAGYQSRSSINKIELGKRNIPQSSIVEIAASLDVTPGFLLGDKPQHDELVARQNENRSALPETLFDKARFREAMGNTSAMELALRLGCPKSSISMYLSGQRVPSKMAIQLISLNLGVSPEWLCGLDAPKYSNAKIIKREENHNPAPTNLSPEEIRLVEIYRRLDQHGQTALMSTAKGLLPAFSGGADSAGNAEIA